MDSLSRGQVADVLVDLKRRIQATSTFRDGHVTFMNAIAETLTGWPRAESEGPGRGSTFVVRLRAAPGQHRAA